LKARWLIRAGPKILASDYADYLSAGASNISDQIQKLSGQLSGIAENKKLKDDQKKVITSSPHRPDQQPTGTAQ
jgi:hypothetical protein